MRAPLSHTRFDPPFVLLDDRLKGRGGRLYRGPVEIVRCDRMDGLESALQRLDRATGAGLHAAGWLAYEAGAAFEPRLARHEPSAAEPMLWFGLFPTVEPISQVELDGFFRSLPPPPPLSDLQPGHGRAEHMRKVSVVRELIEAGDVYQVNLTFPICFRYEGAPLSLYAALRARQATAHSALIATGREWLLSISPELFVEAEAGTLRARPMKGTSPRGQSCTQDQALKHELQADPKQRAENLMIVDLLRNDLSRVCRPGSVRTSNLFAAETYETFHALTSTIEGEPAPRQPPSGVIRALFPCGSVTGAPKLRAQEVIAQLETAPRGAYTGAIGALAPDGAFRFNVAIRTAVLTGSTAGRYSVGGGVVADSDPAAEYEEALLKGKVLTDLAEDYQLLETLRWSPGRGFVRLDLHLDRLTRSAAALGFQLDLTLLDAKLSTLIPACEQTPQRIRLTLSRDGRLTLNSGPAPAWPDRPVWLSLASQRLDAADPFLGHKTTRRGAHEAAVAEVEALGADEPVLLNRDGAVADGGRATLFARIDGRLLTPRLEDGALRGVLRRRLLDRGALAEAPLTLPDLRRAETLLVGNSLRGLARAILA